MPSAKQTRELMRKYCRVTRYTTTVAAGIGRFVLGSNCRRLDNGQVFSEGTNSSGEAFEESDVKATGCGNMPTLQLQLRNEARSRQRRREGDGSPRGVFRAAVAADDHDLIDRCLCLRSCATSSDQSRTTHQESDSFSLTVITSTRTCCSTPVEEFGDFSAIQSSDRTQLERRQRKPTQHFVPNVNRGVQLNLTKTTSTRNGRLSDVPFALSGTNISECSSYVYLGYATWLLHN
ncbi:unnamed protein product [Heligmosomoides polygyrus]|uniref:Uncharacterized protein n=1 Tax=Heligmosomoides polygyrus TaxID=6339 RepID=A0A183FG82_HELPZ|nr:unnamed protein product [Heligmosomoides polygyrus]